VSGFLQKPFTIDRLSAKIAEVMQPGSVPPSPLRSG